MKKEEATLKTTSTLIVIAREHFVQQGFFDVSLEKIAEEAAVTRGAVYHHFKSKKGLFTAVLECVQKNVAEHVLNEATKSDEPWQQLVLGCVGFVKGANAEENRRILLVDAPAVLGWEQWRKFDLDNSVKVMMEHLEELKNQGYLREDVDIKLMAYSISGATNELALNYKQYEGLDCDNRIAETILHFLNGFKSHLDCSRKEIKLLKNKPNCIVRGVVK